MDATDVIPLATAKRWLNVDDSYNDADITRLIKTAVAWIEKYTCYRLFVRDEEITTFGCQSYIPYYPINSKSIKLFDGAPYVDQPYTYVPQALSLKVSCPELSTIFLNTGYEDTDDIPQPLIDGCLKLITYLFENRDAYSTELPLDIQVLINQYRRSATI